jgi:hypothetical protein|tara:strand:- start:256 stop:495 length:240 start_codon:yes stop_codon:yes gene_type:complete
MAPQKKIDRVIQAVRNYLGEEGIVMTTGSTPGKPGFSSAAPAKGPTAGFDPVMGKMERRKKYLSLGPGSRKRWMKKGES